LFSIASTAQPIVGYVILYRFERFVNTKHLENGNPKQAACKYCLLPPVLVNSMSLPTDAAA
jgi:hypothetical protein